MSPATTVGRRPDATHPPSPRRVEGPALRRPQAAELAACEAATADRRASARCAEIIPELIVELL